MCTSLKKASVTELICQTSHCVRFCLVISPPCAAASALHYTVEDLEDRAINSITVLGDADAATAFESDPWETTASTCPAAGSRRRTTMC